MAHARLPRLLPLFLFLFCLTFARRAGSHVHQASTQLATDALEWPAIMSMYESDEFIDEEEEGDYGSGDEFDRRLLFWRRMRYYISYGALSANRIPCPPRSGRSYYTHNCFKARGPVHPYTRGCSAITRCRR